MEASAQLTQQSVPKSSTSPTADAMMDEMLTPNMQVSQADWYAVIIYEKLL